METITVVIGGVLILALTAAVTILAWHGTIDGQAAIGFFTGLSLAGVVGGAQHVAVKTAAKSAMTMNNSASKK